MHKHPVSGAALVVLLLGSVFVWAVPGEPDRLIPFRGVLQQDGASLTVPDLPMTFSLFDADTAGTPLWSSTRSVAVADGVFAVALGSETSLPDSVFEQQRLFLEVEVDGTPLAGRQRVFAAASAVRAGHATEIRSNEATPVTGLTLTPGASVDILLDGNRATISGDMTTTGEHRVNGNVTVDGVYNRPGYTDGCPDTMSRVGPYCIDNAVRGPAPMADPHAGSALQTCHNLGAMVCPTAALMICDNLNLDNAVDGSCGDRTDQGTPSSYRIHTSDIGWSSESANTPFATSAYDNFACYDPTNAEASNSFDRCADSQTEEFFCCTFAAPTMR